MTPPPDGDRLPSITAVTFRRGILSGRLYLAIGTVVSLILTVVLLRSAHGSQAFVATFPLEVPLFATLGAMGGLLLFVSDRSKGVLEYLISYGVRPARLFANCLLTTAGLSSIVLGAALAVGLGGFLATGNLLSSTLVDSVLGYTIPMTYASSLLAATAGVIWSSLSSPRTGLNSPVGVAPIVGIAPPLVVLILAESVAKSEYYYVTVGSALAFLGLAAILLLASTRLLGRERYLSMM
jgi:hypothetical protein